EKTALIDGSAISAGDAIVGITSSGPHSNGYSLIRRIVERAGITSDNGGFELDIGGVSLADALLAPTTIYVKPILELLYAHPAQQPARPCADVSTGAAIHGMAHITGGGLVENIIRVVPDGLGIRLDSATWTEPPLFDWLMREGRVGRGEMWRTFNCGIGYTLIVGRRDVSATLASLAQLGLDAREIGEVLRCDPDARVRID
ncbi:MAG: AIR synthase-related protein, partial [Rhodanobacteraceae bacterium]